MNIELRSEIQQNTLTRFAENLPYKTLAGKWKVATDCIPKTKAQEYSYIRANGAISHYIIFDIDHSDCYLPEQYNCPMPTIIAMDRHKLSHHSYYELDKPLPSQEKLSEKSQKLLDYVITCYKKILRVLSRLL